ncbi:hypothetical protein PVAP13_6KG389032 [Panicum virgatum]|uniref:Uncharacterized protein n=1 Tax=Panicum virgatum TaxID=38727 RepID=A0A8T0RJX4_PANVG|nr:hypothetical protein PVAP13_6KG389032 [Panicum virgatum]
MPLDMPPRAVPSSRPRLPHQERMHPRGSLKEEVVGGHRGGALEMGAARGMARVRRETLAACMTCPLCRGLLREATTITQCLHTCEFSLSLSPSLYLSVPSRSLVLRSLSRPVSARAPAKEAVVVSPRRPPPCGCWI